MTDDDRPTRREALQSLGATGAYRHAQNAARAAPVGVPSPATIVPDDQGQARVQENGQLYVGREYAGETLRWWVARTEPDRPERRRPDWWALEPAVTRREVDDAE